MQPVLQARDICETANITTVQKRKLQKMLLRALENFSIAMTSILILTCPPDRRLITFKGLIQFYGYLVTATNKCD